MLNRFLTYSILIYCTLLLVACSPKKNLQESDIKNNTTATDLWLRINEQRLDFEWYHAKADVQVSFEDFTMGGQADIRIRKDSVIFVSLRKFGLELGRALIRPDSVFALNRLQANYIAMSIDSLKSEFDVPFGFEHLQDLMVGNQIAGAQKPIISFQDEKGIHLKMADKDLISVYLISNDYQVRNAKFQDKSGRKIEIGFDEYRDYEGIYAAGKRAYFYPERMNPEYQFEFVLEKVIINQPKKIRFEIPSNYTRM